MSACVRSGPWHDHFLSSHYRNNWAPASRHGPVLALSLLSLPGPEFRHPAPSLLEPALLLSYHCHVIVGLINFAVKKISQPKQGCYVRASTIRLHHFTPAHAARPKCPSGRGSLGLTRKFVLTPLTQNFAREITKLQHIFVHS